jgi:hypothetical protein
MQRSKARMPPTTKFADGAGQMGASEKTWGFWNSLTYTTEDINPERVADK